MRSYNTNCLGHRFAAETVEAVWRKATATATWHSSEYRLDACGAVIHKGSYGTTGYLGWEIDHLRPVAHGGGDELEKLQPLHWMNNRFKGDRWPEWTCALTV